MTLESQNFPLESHPILPWLPENAVLLMCGTFPPARKRWSMDFYYPNFINDMWRIFGIVFYGDKDALVDIPAKTFRLDKIKNLLLEKGVALSDTGREVKRTMGNASDKYLEILKSIDLKSTLSRMPICNAIATTGEKAASVIAEATGSVIPKLGTYVEFDGAIIGRPGVNMLHFRMPSSSRAYPMKLLTKADHYGKMAARLGMITEEQLMTNLNKSGL